MDFQNVGNGRLRWFVQEHLGTDLTFLPQVVRWTYFHKWKCLACVHACVHFSGEIIKQQVIKGCVAWHSLSIPETAGPTDVRNKSPTVPAIVQDDESHVRLLWLMWCILLSWVDTLF